MNQTKTKIGDRIRLCLNGVRQSAIFDAVAPRLGNVVWRVTKLHRKTVDAQAGAIKYNGITSWVRCRNAKTL